MSWFWRGFQSAIFYYVSCAPCTKLAYQRRQRKNNKRARAEHMASEAEQGLYRHPSPFNTNVYWKEEMAMGPGPPQRKQRDQKERERERERHKGDRGLATGGVGSSAVTGASSADTVVGSEATDGREVDQERNSEDGWNRRRYQREDEMLWGVHVDGGSRKETPKVGRSRTGTASSAGSYKYGCNPAVNDLHPPIVSTRPTNRSEMRWMLQPPPSARIMEGKEPANRSRSGSGGSYGSGRSNGSSRRMDTNLGRQVGEKLIEGRMRRDASLDTTPVTRAISKEDTTSGQENIPPGQLHDTDRRPSSGSQISSTKSTTSSRKPAPPPLSIAPDLRPPASRPPLSTINSTPDMKIPASDVVANSKLLRPALLPMDSSLSSSLHNLQELVSPLSLDMGSVGSPKTLSATRRASSPLPEASFALPPTDVTEEKELGIPIVEGRNPAKDSWQLS